MHIRAITTAISYVVTLKQGFKIQDIIGPASSGGISVYGNANGSSLAPGIALVQVEHIDYGNLLKHDKRILSVELDREITTILPIGPIIFEKKIQSTDTFPWGIDRCDGTLDGKVTRSVNTGLGISIYVIDTGVYGAHHEFKDGNGKSRVEKGMDFTISPPGRGDADCHGHGTHTASTAAGITLGYATKATIVPVKVLSCRGSGTISNVILGINWASKQPGPKVLSMSLGGGRSIGIDKATALAVSRNAVVVVAAGNDNSDACDHSPAAESTAITVAATDIKNRRASYSNYGKCVDLFAPGSDILGASPVSTVATRVLSGTSMACPHVTGVVATMLQETPLATPAIIQQKLMVWAEKNTIADTKPETPNIFLRNAGATATPTVTPKPTTLAPTMKPVTPKPTTRPVTPKPTPPPVMPVCSRQNLAQCTAFKDQCTWFVYWNCRAKEFCGFKRKDVCSQHADYCIWDLKRRCIPKK